MSQYTDSVLARLEATGMPEAEESEAPSSGLSGIREPSGGLDPFATSRPNPSQLAQRHGRRKYSHN